MVVITPDSPVSVVFGKSHAKRKLVTDGLGIRTVGELLRHFPRRYVDMTVLADAKDLVPGAMVTVVGEVVSGRRSQFRRQGRTQHRVEIRVRTRGPEFAVTFFTPYAAQADKYLEQMPAGARGLFTGRLKVFNSRLQLEQARHWMVEGDGSHVRPPRLMPVYPLTAKLYSEDLVKVIGGALELVTGIEEPLPDRLREQYDLVDLVTAYRWVHLPQDRGQVARARRRFRFDEALVLQLVLARRRATLAAQGAQARTGGQGTLLAEFDRRLPFELTEGQRLVGEQVEQDLARPHPMHRLLQGEVGSGKTLVALRAMLRVVDSGGQAALLAPTEVLAQQHQRSIAAMLGDLGAAGTLHGAPEGTSVALLTGSMPRAARAESLLRIASGEAGIVIGTHALLQEHVSFADLGLVVVDEQHRFGVEQRAALTDKAGTPPHVLVMTATPIPRTVAMTVFGDLETSVLRELPAGRAPVQTTLVPLAEQPGWIARVWQRVREEVEKGHQVYVVCPRIQADEAEPGEVDPVEPEEDDDAGAGAQQPVQRPAAAVEDVVGSLRDGPLEGLRVEPLHGRMPADEKDRTMRAFAAGQVDVLVSTTVIEVGVDVANATTMVLLDADRFGVSQLHQLRGRVGRGGLPGLCLLLTHAEDGTPARERLAAVEATTDGFELSRVDLEQRREGDVLGARQSGGRSGLVTLRVLRDEETIVAAREAAVGLLAQDPDLASAPGLARAVRLVELDESSDFLEKS